MTRVAIIGLGYVGLPLALAFLEAGHEVIGVDASSRRVEELQAGRSPIDDIDDARLGRGLADGFRIVTSADADLAAADSVFVCVPTPLTQSKDPDLGPVLAAADLVASHLRAGQLVVLQSTT
ncbi:MAG: NAD(P)-binding domain-containing protein, partial [Candidatus Limnocylindrales bacterium]